MAGRSTPKKRTVNVAKRETTARKVAAKPKATSAAKRAKTKAIAKAKKTANAKAPKKPKPTKANAATKQKVAAKAKATTKAKVSKAKAATKAKAPNARAAKAKATTKAKVSKAKAATKAKVSKAKAATMAKTTAKAKATSRATVSKAKTSTKAKSANAKAVAELTTAAEAPTTASEKRPAESNHAASAPKVPSPTTNGVTSHATAAVSPSTERSPNTRAPTSPSDRVLATCAELPSERALTDEERDAMAKVSETAREFVGADGAPGEVIERIAEFVDEVRVGRRDAPESQDVRLGLGVLWGEQLRAQVGWRWVHLTYPDGFASYALVPDDRAFACFPLNRLPEALHQGGTNTSAHVFESIRTGTLPARKANAYLVIG